MSIYIRMSQPPFEISKKTNIQERREQLRPIPYIMKMAGEWMHDVHITSQFVFKKLVHTVYLNRIIGRYEYKIQTKVAKTICYLLRTISDFFYGPECFRDSTLTYNQLQQGFQGAILPLSVCMVKLHVRFIIRTLFTDVKPPRCKLFLFSLSFPM